jgi:hypothetical protein
MRKCVCGFCMILLARLAVRSGYQFFSEHQRKLGQNTGQFFRMRALLHTPERRTVSRTLFGCNKMHTCLKGSNSFTRTRKSTSWRIRQYSKERTFHFALSKCRILRRIKRVEIRNSFLENLNLNTFLLLNNNCIPLKQSVLHNLFCPRFLTMFLLCLRVF